MNSEIKICQNPVGRHSCPTGQVVKKIWKLRRVKIAKMNLL